VRCQVEESKFASRWASESRRGWNRQACAQESPKMLELPHAASFVAVAVATVAILGLMIAAVYACSSKEERQAATSTVGEEVSDEEAPAIKKRESFISSQMREIEEEAREREREEAREKERQEALAREEEKARAIEIELTEKKRQEEKKYEEEKREAARIAQEERVRAAEENARKEAEAAAAAEEEERQRQLREEKEDFPPLPDDAVFEGVDGEQVDVVTTSAIISDMESGSYTPRHKASLSVSTKAVPKERRLSAVDSPYGRLLANSPQQNSKQSVAQILYSAYPGLGVQVMEEFLEEVGVEFETDLGLLEEADVLNLDTGKFESDVKEKLWKAVCRHRDQVGKRARKLRKSITIVDPTIIPSPERTQPKDLIEWFEHNEIPGDVQASLRELGLENLDDINFLERGDLAQAKVPAEIVDIIMNAITLKKLQDGRGGPRGRGAMM